MRRSLLLCFVLLSCGRVAVEAPPTTSTAGTAGNAVTVVSGAAPEVAQTENHLGTELREVPTTSSLTPAVFAGPALIGDFCTVEGDVAHTSSQERLLCSVDRSTARLRWRLA